MPKNQQAGLNRLKQSDATLKEFKISNNQIHPKGAFNWKDWQPSDQFHILDCSTMVWRTFILENVNGNLAFPSQQNGQGLAGPKNQQAKPGVEIKLLKQDGLRKKWTGQDK